MMSCIDTENKFRIKRQGFKYNTYLKVFPLQQHAFDFFDERMNHNRNEKEGKVNNNNDKVEVELVGRHCFTERSLCFSLEPRLFAFEYNSQSKRKYLVCHLGRFIQDYWIDTSASSRHHYELIRQGTPCRLYFGTFQCYIYYYVKCTMYTVWI